MYRLYWLNTEDLKKVTYSLTHWVTAWKQEMLAHLKIDILQLWLSDVPDSQVCMIHKILIILWLNLLSLGSRKCVITPSQMDIVLCCYKWDWMGWVWISPVPKTIIVCHSCFVEKYKMGAVQWENDFNTFFANNSQYIMIFSILQQRRGMLVVLGGHLVNIGDGYWWF